LASPARNVGGITQALWEALHGGKVRLDLCDIPDANRPVCADIQNSLSVSTETAVRNYFPDSMLALIH
jgi:hypothetical protein